MFFPALTLTSFLSFVLALPAPTGSEGLTFPADFLDDANTDAFLNEALSSSSAQSRSNLLDYLSTFTFDKTVVAQNTAKDVSYDLKGPDNCKVFPGDKAWPSDALWSGLKQVTLGAVESHKPMARVCYANDTGSVDEAACQALTSGWTDVRTILPDPIEVMSPTLQGLSCQPPDLFDKNGMCLQGGYPVYTLTAEHVAQVQLAVNFARNTGIRLVIKNTGHDFLSRSSGAGSLSVWTHNMKDLEFIPQYSGAGGYSGAAIKAGAGVEGRNLSEFAHQNGVVTVGGICVTVGTLGGYAQGGGHSPLSALHGLGADQILSFEAVTSDGRLVVASETQNSDLYWALRGGGAGTFAILVSATIKAHKEASKGYTAATWSFETADASTDEAFKGAVRSWLSYFPENADKKVYSYLNLIPTPDGGTTFSMIPYLAPDTTLEEGQEILRPWLDEVKALGIDVNPAWEHYDSYDGVYRNVLTYGSANAYGSFTSNRLFPRENWADEASFNETFDAIYDMVVDGLVVLPYNFQVTDDADNASNPAWRKSIAYIILATAVDYTQSPEAIMEDRLAFTNGPSKRWRDLAPGAGSYANEGDRLEPNFQWAFYGSNYPKLLDIKKKYDPFNLFYSAVTPGSEFFEVRSFDGVLQNENGKLCKKANPSLYYPEG